jgi:signal transduction histidine kinase
VVRSTRERLERVCDTLPHIVWLATADGRLEYGNEAWKRLIGSRPGTDVETSLRAKIHRDDRDRRSEQWRHARRSARPYEVEYRLAERDENGARWYLEHGAPLHAASRHAPDGWAMLATPVGSYKRIEEDLRQALRSREDFFAVLLHELRNPLAPIANALELLGRGAGENHAVTVARGIIQRQLRQLTRLVDDLMDVASISQGRLRLDRRTVDLREVLEIAIESARPLIELRRQVLTVTPYRASLLLAADPVRLSQVVTNLLINAAKYTQPGGHISLLLQQEQAQMCIRVRDDGIGIAPERIGEMFQLFSQATPGPAGGGGVGVGLAVARQLVEMHGGTLDARSEGLGRGTEFTIRLPRAG